MSLLSPPRRPLLMPAWSRNDLWRRAAAVPSLDLNFAATENIGPLVTFTRASTATFLDSAGVLQTAATDVPRFDHDPTTGESLGLMVEEQRMNSIRNNTMVGAVAGTPGTSPTNWSIGGLSGLTQTIVGTGTESGIAYIDIRIFGTTSSALFYGISPEGTTVVAATPNSIWTSTFYVRLAAGSLANVTGLKNVITNFNSAGVALNQFAVTSFTPTSAALSTQRSSCSTTSATFADATTAFARSLFQVEANSGAAIDITLRIGLPQLEQGAFATSVIPTTTAAATRSADVASITGANFSSWYRQDEGTVFADASSYMGAAAVTRGLVSIDGAAGDVHRFFRQSDLQPVIATLVSSVVQSVFGFGPTWITSAAQKLAYAYAANNFGGSANGSVAQTDNSGTIPTANTLNVGSLSGSNYFGGTIRRLTYWPSRLPNSTLQAITQ